MIRIQSFLLFSLLLAVSAAGAVNAPLRKVSLQLSWMHQFEFAGFYAAKEQGYYAEAGLDVEFFEYEAGIDPTQEVIDGKKTFGVTGSDLVSRRLQGAPVLLLSNYFKRSPLAIVAKPEIRIPSDLKGKGFMVETRELDSVSFSTMFRQFGLTGTDLKIVPHSFDTQDFIAGKVDAMSVFLTNDLFELQQAGVPYNIIDPSHYGGEADDINLLTSESYASANPEIVRAFRQASDRGWVYALAHPEDIIDLILRQYDSRGKTRAALEFEARETARVMLPKVYPVGSIDPNKLRRIGETMVQAGEATSLDRLEGMIFEPTGTDGDAKSAATLALTEAERAFLQAHPVVRVSNQLDWPPYDFFENGMPRGYSVDLMNLLAARIGVTLEFVQGANWDELVDWFCARRIDLLHPSDKPREVLDCGSFSPPIIQVANQFLTRKDRPAVHSIADLFGSVAASPKGWEQTELLKRRFGDKFRIIETDNIGEAIDAVNQGRADFTTDFANVLNYHIARSGYVNLKVQGVWNREDRGEEYAALHIATRKDWPTFQTIIDKALASLPPGELRILQDKWFGETGGQAARLTLSPEQRDYLRRKGSLRMCVDPAWMPAERITEDGVHEGIIADVFARLAEMLETNIVLTPTANWEESLAYAKERRCDLLSGAISTPSRQTFLDFTTPYLSFRSVIATQTQQVFINDFESVLGETFGIVRGYALIDALQARYPGIRLREVANTEDGFRQVQEGRVFGFIDALPTIAYRIQTQALFDMKIAGQLEDSQNLSWNLSIATRGDEPLLQEIFQSAINAFPQEQRQEIVNRWLSTHYEKVFDYVLMWKIVAGVVGIAGAMLWAVLVWNRRLAKLNRELGLARAHIATQNYGLEQRVAERTHDLRETLAQLERAQTDLVQSEKLAALGDLVAGIAHELNTPIGNAVMLASTLADQEFNFREQMAAGLSRAALQRFVDAVRDNSEILLRSLQRAAELIGSFKQVAVDQASYQRRNFALEEVTREIALTLHPRLRHSPATLDVSVAPDLWLDSFPGPLGQVLMNLIQNALLHAFEGRAAGQIRIESRPAAPGHVGIRISDDGCGIDPANLGRIFDPFFTTRLGQGGSGLGLHIVYNLVTGLLGGTITVQSVPGQGTAFDIELPSIAPLAMVGAATASGAGREPRRATGPAFHDPSHRISA
ncbi:ABC transporter substrate-binding protein [Thiocystis violascens]|uniref:histidine kinase n=1 Tax=Thiocystis violascens (strain ATCC 17096 / DSM 198 / 6111) TaxID=765911 RepID=I3Y561_THIV6|nr:transporter substrate-binding domain-containing protein [Thiocystis violascens]AFL72129.1 histidine kinase,histidine kinase,extracellular solute-binding protein, family 3 [Thiocystis violascens DSM 198]